MTLHACSEKLSHRTLINLKCIVSSTCIIKLCLSPNTQHIWIVGTLLLTKLNYRLNKELPNSWDHHKKFHADDQKHKETSMGLLLPPSLWLHLSCFYLRLLYVPYKALYSYRHDGLRRTQYTRTYWLWRGTTTMGGPKYSWVGAVAPTQNFEFQCNSFIFQDFFFKKAKFIQEVPPLNFLSGSATDYNKI
jgi:hypothetical protein